ncbi:hypothetical protein ACH47B_04045 [Rhodococcus sp. NPDC019627]|uniref:Bacteriocin biosynthesis cyclodehydratase domain-containing protein n=1 Tax=Rhodococcus oxybenzonivorans TaxID=1990687 RepID=A0A2S2BXD5_9NOCA|nr:MULTISPECIES: hypothetical protein [Rhodococcus]AWK73310.1 hypothetical protein CBI38_18830 [Rhodococcus oxybenzonivorans]MDV7352592.1 hypothetical protein [Rhodococcus oxybenzonivorans]QTJ69054.1 hypothetical protein HYG77_28255 [Rhodococcus sp. ZPP]
MTVQHPRPIGPTLDPRIAVLTRPDGRVQFGWDPERALILEPPPGILTEQLLAILRLLDGKTSRPHVLWTAVESGMSPTDFSKLLGDLDRAGLLDVTDSPDAAETHTVRVHGRGPLSDAVSAGLTDAGIRVSRSSRYSAEGDVRRWNATCAVLADDLVAEPRLVADLVRSGIPHLPVRVRDGRGVVGPLVLPGHTSCLRCADLLRSAYDQDWPHLAAQLLGTVGHASPAVIMATTAVALGQLEVVLSSPRGHAPASLDATLEIDLGAHRLVTRRWPRQVTCSCAYLAPAVGESSRLPS